MNFLKVFFETPRDSAWWLLQWSSSSPYQKCSSAPPESSILLWGALSPGACTHRSAGMRSHHRKSSADAAQTWRRLWPLNAKSKGREHLKGVAKFSLTCRRCCCVWIRSLHCWTSSFSLSISSSWLSRGTVSLFLPAFTWARDTEQTVQTTHLLSSFIYLKS